MPKEGSVEEKGWPGWQDGRSVTTQGNIKNEAATLHNEFA